MEEPAACAFFGALRAHVFAYSPRAQTAAEKLPGPVPNGVKADRARRLYDICRESAKKFAARQVGKTVRVLIEKDGCGYADNYLRVKTDAKADNAGKLVDVLLTGACDGGCMGTVTGENRAAADQIKGV